MRAFVACSLIVSLASPTAQAGAQWSVAGEIGVARFAGTLRDSSGIVVGPYRPTTFELRIADDMGAVRVGIALMYAKTGLAGEQSGVAVVQYDGASLWEIASLVSLRLARSGLGVEARAEAGPTLDLWTLDADSRSRFGGRAGLAVEWPLANSITGALRVTGVLSSSIANGEDIPAGAERLSTRRVGVAVGVRYRL